MFYSSWKECLSLNMYPNGVKLCLFGFNVWDEKYPQSRIFRGFNFIPFSLCLIIIVMNGGVSVSVWLWGWTLIYTSCWLLLTLPRYWFSLLIPWLKKKILPSDACHITRKTKSQVGVYFFQYWYKYVYFYVLRRCRWQTWRAIQQMKKWGGHSWAKNRWEDQ